MAGNYPLYVYKGPPTAEAAVIINNVYLDATSDRPSEPAIRRRNIKLLKHYLATGNCTNARQCKLTITNLEKQNG